MGIDFKKEMKKFAILITIFLLFTLVVFAEGAVIENPITYNTFGELFNSIIDWIIDIALVLAPLFFVYGGFLYITSAGDPSKSSQGKKLMIYAAIGLLVVLLARSLVDTIKGFVSL